MNVQLSQCSVVELAPDCTLTITGAPGMEIVGVRGTAWVTEDASQDDRFLAPGERIAVEPGNRMYVSALKPAAVRLIQRPIAGRARWSGWMAARWASWFDMEASRRHAERLWGVI